MKNSREEMKYSREEQKEEFSQFRQSIDQQRADVKETLHFYSEQVNQNVGERKTHKGV